MYTKGEKRVGLGQRLLVEHFPLVFRTILELQIGDNTNLGQYEWFIVEIMEVGSQNMTKQGY